MSGNSLLDYLTVHYQGQNPVLKQSRKHIKISIDSRIEPDLVVETIAPEIEKVFGYGALDIKYKKNQTIIQYDLIKKEADRVVKSTIRSSTIENKVRAPGSSYFYR